MYHPGITPSEYGDEEVYKKMGELAKRINIAYAQGNAEMVSQLQMLYENLQLDMQERMFLKQEQKSSPICVETDPDMVKLNQSLEPTKPKKTLT